MRIVILTLLAATAAVPASGQAAVERAAPEVVTSASAERTVRADLALLSLEYTRDGASPAEAGRRTALKADSLRRAFRVAGVAPDSVIDGSRYYWWDRRMELVVQNRAIPRYEERNGTRERVQDSTAVDSVYRAREQLQVRIRDMQRVGAVIDAALAQGITSISGVTFSATDTEREQREALQEATRKARARAEEIATSGGGRLGRTLRLSTEGNGEPARYTPFDAVALQEFTGTGTAASPSATVVVAPVLRVTATVYGRWELVEGAPR